jgi:hypothetical protein
MRIVLAFLTLRRVSVRRRRNMFSPRPTQLILMSVVFLVALTVATAQIKEKTSTTTGPPETQVTVERGQVAYVAGNDLFVKMEDGQIRHFDVPDSARVSVEGQELGVRDLKPGMKLERTLTVTTIPKTVTTVETVTGTVWEVTAPQSVILTLENGENQRFMVPKNQKFTIDGQEIDVFGLRKGMKVTAARITEVPEVEVKRQKQVTGSMPPPQIAPDVPILILVLQPDATPPTPPNK